MDPMIRRLLLHGHSIQDVAARFGMSPQTIAHYRTELGLRHSGNGSGHRGPSEYVQVEEAYAAYSAMEAHQAKRLAVILEGAAAGRPFSTDAWRRMYGGIRRLTPAEHWASIGKPGYKPKGRPGA